jgi:anaerobic dimethyl sulfoxide reductase subunit B (iron-sulfur subunit)
MTQLGFYFNANECIGCKVCVAACKDVHNLPVGYKLRKVVTGEAGGWETDAASGVLQPRDVFAYSVSYSCMHCAHPACMEACPKGAVSKDADTGIVSIDQALCIGCGRCAKACPWDAPVVVPGIDGTRVSRKCDLCADLLAQGEEPACVAACLMRCLKVVVFDGDAYVPVTYAPTAPPLAPPAGVSEARRSAAQDAAHPSCAPLLHALDEGFEFSVQTAQDTPAGGAMGTDGATPGAADPLIADVPELEPHYLFVPHRGRVEHPDARIRVHSMPEEYING